MLFISESNYVTIILMTYVCSVLINAPLDRVWKVYTHPETMYTWQADLKSYYDVEGEEYDAVRIYEIAGEQTEFHQKNILQEKPTAEFVLINGNEVRHIKDEFTESNEITEWKRLVKITNKNIIDNMKLFFHKEDYRKHTMEHMQGFQEKATQ